MSDESEALRILTHANEHAEVGYAHSETGSASKDWAAVQDCVRRQWLVYSHDASVGGRNSPEGGPFQQRSIYRLTIGGAIALSKHRGLSDRAKSALARLGVEPLAP